MSLGGVGSELINTEEYSLFKDDNSFNLSKDESSISGSLIMLNEGKKMMDTTSNWGNLKGATVN